jgi:hypothetical protein
LHRLPRWQRFASRQQCLLPAVPVWPDQCRCFCMRRSVGLACSTLALSCTLALDE